MITKKNVSWTIDKDIIKKVSEDAIKNQRSESYIANTILKKNYEASDKEDSL